MLTVNASAVQQSILKARQEIENKLKSMMVGFAADIADAATQATPLGDAQKFTARYAQRQAAKGYDPKEGLAKGNWQYSESGSAVFVANYDPNAAQTAISNVKAKAKGSFNVGDTFYIANSLDYIGMLQNNSSQQTAGQGIVYPALDILLSIYKINLKANYDAGATK